MLTKSTRPTHHKVHFYFFPLLCRNTKLLHRPTRPLMLYHNLLICRAHSNKLYNISLHPPSPIDLSQVGVHLSVPRMNRVACTMCFCKNSFPQVIYTWNTQTTLTMQNTIYLLGENLYFLISDRLFQLNKTKTSIFLFFHLRH